MKLSALLLALVLNGPGSQILTVPEPNRIEAVDVTNNRRIPSDTIKPQSGVGGDIPSRATRSISQ